ncbi:MAG TPA: UDP-N-acetylglucosamine--N-acetylmuramyl-(pentapeptide) pyrophosphoryl-undecaprenol N-acetylglucosamine transferase [Candidatus Portnoybacteria bacterium]|nr:UDP-N-acetylglucosamine--N-acetylmuramyl-(pentapeptide) pyrophosphoryl-undecaprenol N-acetylglucosamine transferase [Candidatus Portnoybacteria bacterium]
MRLLLTGGGTGGHLFPLLAIIRQIKKIAQEKNINLEIFFIGPKTPHQEKLVEEGVQIKNIPTGKWRRYGPQQGIKDYFDNFLDIFRFIGGFLACLWHLFIIMPDITFSKGGYGSLPVAIISWIYHIPLLIHESDAIPGLANSIEGHLAKKIFLGFKNSAQYFNSPKTIFTGNPVREFFIKIGQREKLIEERPIKTILVIGGSQGAQAINKIVLEMLSSLTKEYQVIHQCGENNFPVINELIKELNIQNPNNYHLFPFLDENQLQEYYLQADLIISRAGAGSIAEIATAVKPSILIPLTNSANEHQSKNANLLAQAGAALVLDQLNLTPHLFAERIHYLLSHPEKCEEMARKIKFFAHPDSAHKIANEIIKN